MTMVSAKRPYAHGRRKNTLAVTQWILSLVAEGRAYEVVVLEEFLEGTPSLVVFTAERKHILAAIDLGCQLTNGDSGGKGGKRATIRTRIKMSTSHKGKKFSARWRANMSAAKKRRPPESIELRQQKRERALRYFATHPGAFKGKKHTEESKRLNREKHLGKPVQGKAHTPAASVKMQNAWTPERRAAQAERNRERAKEPLSEKIRRAERKLAELKEKADKESKSQETKATKTLELIEDKAS